MSEGQHYYAKSEDVVIPVYNMPTKTGSIRSVSVRDLKGVTKTPINYVFNNKQYKINKIVPSVTTITSVMSKPALEAWKINKAILTASEIPKNNMNDYVYINLVKDKMYGENKEILDFGTEIHASLESYFKEEDYIIPIKYKHFIQPAIDWLESNNIKKLFVEKGLYSDRGYAGLCDFIGTDGEYDYIIDFKTKNTKPDVDIYQSESYNMQLAAYAYAYAEEYLHLDQIDLSMTTCLECEVGRKIKAFNLYISSSEPGRLDVIEVKDLCKHMKVFDNCIDLWYYNKRVER